MKMKKQIKKKLTAATKGLKEKQIKIPIQMIL